MYFLLEFPDYAAAVVLQHNCHLTKKKKPTKKTLGENGYAKVTADICILTSVKSYKVSLQMFDKKNE